MSTGNNPTGKGGFGDNPHNQANGRWKKEDSISYNYNHLLSLSLDELKEYKPVTVAQKIAYEAIKEASSELLYLKEVTDRTEGKAPQAIDHTSGGEKVNIPLIEWVNSTNDKDT